VLVNKDISNCKYDYSMPFITWASSTPLGARDDEPWPVNVPLIFRKVVVRSGPYLNRKEGP